MLAAVALLALASAVVNFARLEHGADTLLGFGQAFDVRREGNVPTWFSSALLLACSAVLAAVSMRAGADARHWLVLAVLFALLSMDETASLHEQFGTVGRRFDDRPGWLVRPWVVLAAPVVIAVLVAYVPFFRRRPRPVRRAFGLGAVLFVGGALGVELVEIALSDGARDTAPLTIATSVQELMEMLGAAAFLHGGMLALGLRAGSPASASPAAPARPAPG